VAEVATQNARRNQWQIVRRPGERETDSDVTFSKRTSRSPCPRGATTQTTHLTIGHTSARSGRAMPPRLGPIAGDARAPAPRRRVGGGGGGGNG